MNSTIFDFVFGDLCQIVLYKHIIPGGIMNSSVVWHFLLLTFSAIKTLSIFDIFLV